MKKLFLTIVLTYLILDGIFLFCNHFDLHNKPKPFFLVAMWPCVKDISQTLYWGNDPTVIPFSFLFLIGLIGITLLSYYIIEKINKV